MIGPVTDDFVLSVPDNKNLWLINRDDNKMQNLLSLTYKVQHLHTHSLSTGVHKPAVVDAEVSYSLYFICNMTWHKGSEIRQNVFDDLCHWLF